MPSTNSWEVVFDALLLGHSNMPQLQVDIQLDHKFEFASNPNRHSRGLKCREGAPCGRHWPRSGALPELQKRDEQIVRLREINKELHVTIDGLNAKVVSLQQTIRVLLVRLGFDASELRTDPEIAEAANL